MKIIKYHLTVKLMVTCDVSADIMNEPVAGVSDPLTAPSINRPVPHVTCILPTKPCLCIVIGTLLDA